MYVDEGTLRVLELIQQLQRRMLVGIFPESSGKFEVDGACGLVFNDKNGHRDICDPDTGPVWYPVIGIRLPQGFGCVSSLRLYRWQNGSGVSYDWECQIRITQYRNMNEKTMIVIVTKDNWYVK